MQDTRDLGLIPELGRSLEGGHGNPLQYSCLENPDGQRSLAGYSSRGCKGLYMTEQLSTHVSLWENCRLSTEELMLLNYGIGEDSWESLGLQGDPTSPFWRRSALGFLWREWCWSWNSSTLATSCEELTHWKRLWCWEELGAGGEGDDRGWDGSVASLTRWTWVWVNSGSCWWTGRPGVLQFMGSQSRTRLSDWTELKLPTRIFSLKREACVDPFTHRTISKLC